MSARAPDSIYSLWGDIHKGVPRAVLSGIVGDVAHSFGYHLARRDLPRSDYSTQLPLDQRGANDCASALDISLPPDLMKLCTKRLLDAARAHDPRLHALREFCGTLDGSHTYPWDLHSNSSEGVDSWDDSHLWHIHLSFYRAYADNASALAPIADVIAGKPISKESTMALDADVKARFDSIDAALNKIPDRVLGDDVVPVELDPKNPNWATSSALAYLVRHVNVLQSALAPAKLAAAIAASLPASAGGLSQAELEAAVEKGVRTVFADASKP